MKVSTRKLTFVALLVAAVATAEEQRNLAVEGNTILIEDFSNPVHKWSTMNDPVMGGQSKSGLTIEDGVAKFTGNCAIVPFLQAPGFITMVTGGFFSWHKEVFPDISSCTALSFTLKTNVDYQGYRISFGKEHVKGGRHASGYKAGPLVDLPTEDFGEIVIPLSEFSSKWDDATGDITVTCAEDPQYCPTAKWLANMETMSFWGEGVEGDVDLEIQTISAVGCTASPMELHLAASMNASTIRGLPKAGAFLLLSLLTMILFGVLARRSNRENYDEIPQKDGSTTAPDAVTQLNIA